MFFRFLGARAALVSCTLACVAVMPAQAEFKDPLKTPAMQARVAARGSMTAIAKAGDNRFVAAGWRGLIITSDDAGATWKQAAVPVRTDLTALTFTSAKVGWAAGNDGVVLRTDDGGSNWRLVLDGFKASALMVAYFEKMAEEKADDPVVKAALNEAKGYAAQAPTRPFLDVLFESDDKGYVVGNFNMIFRTMDGGKTWEPLNTLTDNPDGFNIYAISKVGGKLALAGELGLVRIQDEVSQVFRRVKVPYEGSLFAMAATPKAWVLAGLRGNALRSTDGGKTWAPIEFGGDRPGTFVSAAVLDEHSMVLLTSATAYVSRDDGLTFKPIVPKTPMLYTAVVPVDADTVLLAGLQGVRKESLR